MKLKFTTLALIASVFYQTAKAQCTFTTTIVSNGPTTFCTNGNVTLSPGTANNSWTQKADYGGLANYNGSAFVLADKGYVLAGGSTAFYEYDADVNVWTQKTNFPGQVRVGAASFAIAGKGYVCSGQLGVNPRYDVWEYNPSSNTWVQKANIPSSIAGGFGFSLNGKGYIVSGYNVGTSAYSNAVWEYDPVADTWTQKSNFPGQARRDGSGFVIGSTAYYGIGSMSNTLYDDFWEYNAASDTWTQKSNFSGGNLYGAASFVIGTNGYVICGFNYSGSSDKLWKYDNTNDTWALKDNFVSTPMIKGLAFEIANKGYFGIGSVSNVGQRAFWEYDPASSLSYAWSTGEVTADITVYTGGTYSLTITNGLGCTANATQEITEYPAPAIFTNSPFMCFGRSATINASGAATYSWNSGQTTASITVSPNVTTNYTVTGVDTNGCANSEVATVTVHPYNDVTVSLTGSTLSVAQTGVNYQWHQCVTTPPPAGLIPVNGETNQDFSPAANGDYAVVVTNSFGCMDTSACTTVLSVGIAEASDISEIEIYPNPFAEKFIIKCNAAVSKISVINVIGQQIKTIESSAKGDKHEINLEAFPAGIYFINVSLDNQNKVYKVIKE